MATERLNDIKRFFNFLLFYFLFIIFIIYFILLHIINGFSIFQWPSCTYLPRSHRQAILESIETLMQKEQNKIYQPHMTRWLKYIKRFLQQWIVLYSTFAEVSVEDGSKIAELMFAFS